ncbi:hypothetical protein [Methanolobus sp. WCC5]|jgi:hypothetical protein|uniref:hypothetical protein n=1 Tax=Methanolobus sp. WCC5 TaxID=3125785 RepID=UPI003251A80A
MHKDDFLKLCMGLYSYLEIYAELLYVKLCQDETDKEKTKVKIIAEKQKERKKDNLYE